MVSKSFKKSFKSPLSSSRSSTSSSSNKSPKNVTKIVSTKTSLEPNDRSSLIESCTTFTTTIDDSTTINRPFSTETTGSRRTTSSIARVPIRYILPMFALLFIGYCALISISINTFQKSRIQQLVTSNQSTEDPSWYNLSLQTLGPAVAQLKGHLHGSYDSSNDSYLINTKHCHLLDWPPFDEQTLKLFHNVSQKVYHCRPGPFTKNFQIKRVNYTKVQISIVDTVLDKPRWRCYAREIIRNPVNDKILYGSYFGPIRMQYNFDRDLMRQNTNKTGTDNTKGAGAWNGVEIMCNRNGKNGTVDFYTHVVPLIQRQFPKPETITTTSKMKSTSGNNNGTTHSSTGSSTYKEKKPNIILLGVDSVSRLNFIRHFIETKVLADERGFVELKGHHKVGENTFPNLFAMFTGHYAPEYWNWTIGSSYKFDKVPLIFKNFSKEGWITTYVEDMPPFGTFHHNKGGFLKPPVDYYMRPINLAIRPDLNYYNTCYKDRIEFEIYYDYLLELFEYFKINGNQRHFTLAHWSTVTHDDFNSAGYADRIHAHFLRRLFKKKYHKDSVIVLYSDHGLRFGGIMRSQAGVHEVRLPYLYIFVPYLMRLEGRNSKQLKRMLRLNSNRLTSHMDLYATFVHILTGNSTLADQHKYGRTLFRPISTNRTCADAGIPEEFCMCENYVELQPTDYHHNVTSTVIRLINVRLKPYRSRCAYLRLSKINRISVAQNDLLPEQTERHYRIQFETKPGEAMFEVTVLVSEKTNDYYYDTTNSPITLQVVGEITRISRFAEQSYCVVNENLMVARYCYCKQ